MTRALFSALFLVLALAASAVHAAGDLTPEQLASQIQAGKAPLILDVRTEEEYLEGHVPGARLIPHDQIGDYLESLSAHKDDRIVVYCRSGKRTREAIRQLEKAGFQHLIELEGSFQAWKESGQRVEP